MVTDEIESKLYREHPASHKRKPQESICKLFLSNKAVELINLTTILTNTQLSFPLRRPPC